MSRDRDIAAWVTFVGVVVAAFLVGGLLWGEPMEVLNSCSGGGDCPPTHYVDLDLAAGAVFGLGAAGVLLTIGVLRQRRSR